MGSRVEGVSEPTPGPTGAKNLIGSASAAIIAIAEVTRRQQNERNAAVTTLDGVQGVAGSNPAVPIGVTEGQARPTRTASAVR